MSMLKTISDKALSSYVKLQITVGQAREQHSQYKRQRGTMDVKYGLVLAIVITIVIVAANVMSGDLQTFFQEAAKKITEWMKSA